MGRIRTRVRRVLQSPIRIYARETRIFRIRSFVTLILCGLGVILAVDSTAGIYRCTNAAGEVFYSDTICPPSFSRETVNIQSRSTSTSSPPAIDNPYSIMNQARMI